MPENMSKGELIAELDREWAQIERRCFGMSSDEMIVCVSEGDWSAKDILAHLSAWEKYLLDRLGYLMTGQRPLYPVMTTMEDVDDFNARVYQENKDRPLTSIVIEFRNLYSGVMTVLEALDQELLYHPYDYDWPEDGINLLQLIRANTCDHFHEHCGAIGR
jgi:hypothetical protein